MCEHCGCGQPEPQGFHHHDHPHDLTHRHDEAQQGRVIRLEKDILHENNLLAARNRGFFEGLKILCINLVSSPGSGKTTILESTISHLKNDFPVYVIEGDQQSSLDADRISRLQVPVKLINTGSGCHLDAHMVHHALHDLGIGPGSVLFIENVGNLVCPALFDLGEKFRVLIMSVTEGDDKPVKYPYMFRSSQLCLINKIDLSPYVIFSTDLARSNALEVQPDMRFIEVSAQRGDGMDEWYGWIRKEMSKLT